MAGPDRYVDPWVNNWTEIFFSLTVYVNGYVMRNIGHCPQNATKIHVSSFFYALV